MSGAVRTTCPYCGVGCGVIASRGNDGSVTVAGDPAHPANLGRLCSKGSALASTLGEDGRIRHPRVGGARVSWAQATGLVARRFREAVERHGPDAVAFYVSGQLLTEDYYVANKLMKGFIGSANIDTNSRLCMASSVVGHRRAFGSDTVPGTYEDLELADLVVLVGSNLAWCHPVLHQRLAAARAARPQMKVVVVDPRRTVSTEEADLHLALQPDGDVALFTGLLAWLAAHDAVDGGYVRRHVNGMEAAIEAAGAVDLERTAVATGLSVAALEAFFELFRTTTRTVTVYSQGVNQSAQGSDKVNAILNVHLATGRVGRPGCGPFSVTGQPNAMGGREVGGLANTLAAHMELDDPVARERVQRFWRSPVIASRAGLKAVDLFQAMGRGEIKALWIMATNPADSMPRAAQVERALRECPFVVVSEIYEDTDTVRHADVVLPAAGWLEKDGTVTNSERRISRQRPLLSPPGEARPDWWIVCEVARQMGFGASFRYDGPAAIFAEHAALSGFENDGRRDFDLSGLAALDRAAYDALAPVQWPVRAGDPVRGGRLFADGGFFTEDGRARAVALTPTAPPPVRDGVLVLNTGRVRDHWHTLTRTGRSARLSGHVVEPYAELNPGDARARGIADGDLVWVEGLAARVLVRAAVRAGQRPGSVFVPMHWTDAHASAARINHLVPSRTDGLSGQPALKSAPVRVSRADVPTHGFAVTGRRPTRALLEGLAAYWSLARCAGGWRIELGFEAGRGTGNDWEAVARRLLGEGDAAAPLAYRDPRAGDFRFAVFRETALVGALFVQHGPVQVARDWVAAQLATAHDDPGARAALMAGRPGQDRPDPGRLVCACNGVGVNRIVEAVQVHACITLDAVGAQTTAGTGCGSCRAELREIIRTCCPQAAE